MKLEGGWKVHLDVMAGRPFEEQPHDLDRKWKVYTGNSSVQHFLAKKTWKEGKFCRNVLDIFYLYIYQYKNFV